MRILFSLTMLCLVADILSAQDRWPPLSSRDVETLIRDLPDSRLAIEIKGRGIEPLLTQREVRRLRDAGAGSEALAAAMLYLRPSPLTVMSQPPVEGLVVKVGNRVVTTNADGVATITGLVPGSYPMTIEKLPAYPLVERGVSLAEGGSNERVTLRPAPGRLSVVVENARIEVSSRGAYAAPLLHRNSRLVAPAMIAKFH